MHSLCMIPRGLYPSLRDTSMRVHPLLRLLPIAFVLILTLPIKLTAQTVAPAAPVVDSGTLAQRAQSLLGLVAFVFLAFVIGRLRGARTIPWRVIGWGIVLQFAFASLVLFVPRLLEGVQYGVQALLDYTREGATMVFGNLVDVTVPVNDSPFPNPAVPIRGYAQTGAVFAFFVLPTIIFFSALTAILYHSGIMQYVVQGLAWVMAKTTGTSGAETLSTAANIFVGQTEAPLMVRPFVATCTNSELMVIMVGGFANIASGVLGLYTAWLSPFIANAGGHLAAACFISAPATLIVGKLLMPETTTPVTSGGVRFKVEKIDANLIDAAARGTTEGLTLALNVAAMLIAFTALVALINGIIAWSSRKLGLAALTGEPLTLQNLLSYPMAPLAWLTGVPWSDARDVGSLLGIKTVLNELIAYSQMKDRFAVDPMFIAPRSALIATYALCGFANFASIGIQVGGISTLAPGRRADLSRIALLAMIGGAIASFMGACVVGVLL
ncbi:MAG TPA: nucleoside transporter C-terminal domain-containing protein [Tepidisphaeraceae bacterium]|nr:nucleoside transporter C-terminal domain-containing protein [Tepidisphaeraceae bacterium]